MALYLGIDGGTVKTTAIAANDQGKILAKTVGGSIDYKNIGLSQARKNLKMIVNQLLMKTEEKYFSCVCIGSSSLNSRATTRETENLISGIIDTDHAILDSSIFTAMQCMTESGPCALVISGINSMVAARNEKGKITKAGGWGHMFGDEGSGFIIAMEAIRYCIRAFEGSEPPTTMLEDMLEFFDIYSPQELPDRLFDIETQKSKISSFAGRVFSCASAGDVAAKEIIKKQASLLAGTTKALVKDLPKDSAIGLWGGVFVNNRRFRNKFSEAMAELSPDYRIKVLNYPAECGALFAAFKHDGIEITDVVTKNIDLYRGVRV